MKPIPRKKSAAKVPAKKNSPRKSQKKKVASTTTKTTMKQGSKKELMAYFKSYKAGLGDFHIPIFRDLKKLTSPKRLLYPGCHRHITASLVFQDVLYVDSYSKIKGTYSDEKVLEFVTKNKDYPEDPIIKFKCKNFESEFGEKDKSFDLLFSLSAGIISTSCAKYLKTGGYFLASDAHYDARMAFIDPQFEFCAVYDDDKNAFDCSEDAKCGHFVTKSGTAMTKEMVQESIEKPKAKRSFKLQKETLFYLFKKK